MGAADSGCADLLRPIFFADMVIACLAISFPCTATPVPGLGTLNLVTVTGEQNHSGISCGMQCKTQRTHTHSLTLTLAQFLHCDPVAQIHVATLGKREE